MRLFSPHFARPALLQYTVRRTSAHSKFTCTPFRTRCPPRLYCSKPLVGFDDDMGKEDKSSKNFNLKVPKGTRDCGFRPPSGMHWALELT
jgi:histidyl-tRNA synthetase